MHWNALKTGFDLAHARLIIFILRFFSFTFRDVEHI